MRRIIFFLILVLASFVGYMYFFGKGEDKENAQTVVNETRDLGRAVGDFLKRQKEKYDDGEFDNLLDKIQNGLQKLKTGTKSEQEESKDELRKLEKDLRQIDPEQLSDENKDRLNTLLKQLEDQIQEN